MKLPINTGENKLSKYIMKEDWNAVKSRCEKHPREAAAWTKKKGFFDGKHDSCVLPLHQACALRAPRDVICALVKAYPKGVQEVETAFNRLPLHVACQHESSADAIRLLLSYNPLGTQTEDKSGRTPIHYVCSNGASPEVIGALLSIDPSIASFPDVLGWMPIHVACHVGASTESIQMLLNANPGSVNEKTNGGSTPLKLLSKISCKNKHESESLLLNTWLALKQDGSIFNTKPNVVVKESKMVISRAA